MVVIDDLHVDMGLSLLVIFRV